MTGASQRPKFSILHFLMFLLLSFQNDPGTYNNNSNNNNNNDDDDHNNNNNNNNDYKNNINNSNFYDFNCYLLKKL